VSMALAYVRSTSARWHVSVTTSDTDETRLLEQFPGNYMASSSTFPLGISVLHLEMPYMQMKTAQIDSTPTQVLDDVGVSLASDGAASV